MTTLIFPVGTTPSYSNGFARSAAESAHPELWKGLVGAWVPALGWTGSTTNRGVIGGNATVISDGGAYPATCVMTRLGPGMNLVRATNHNAFGVPVFDLANLSVSYTAKWSGSSIYGIYSTDSTATNPFCFGFLTDRWRATNVASGRRWYSATDTLTRWLGTVATFAAYRTAGTAADSVGICLNGGTLLPLTTSATDEAGWSNTQTPSFSFGYESTTSWTDSVALVAKIWNRKLTQAEFAADATDPLAPFRLRTRVFASAGAAPAGWKPYFARQRSRIIGGGVS